jgi:uncharacterized lipoprotein YmbA
VKAISTAGLLCLLCACVSSQPDHFYVLSAQPEDASEARTAAVTQATLKVSLPSLLDRSEIVLNTSVDGVIILDHERWAAPLTDLVTVTLGQDIERRRSDLLIAARSVNHSDAVAIRVTVDIVQVTLRRDARASIETQWRILDSRSGKEVVGGGVFSAPLGRDSAAVAKALSATLSLLADRLAAQMPKMQ